MRLALLRIYWSLERRLAPGLRYSQQAFAEVLESEIAERPVWLDLGCGHQIFADWMQAQQAKVLSRTRRVVGVDLDLASLRAHKVYPDKVLASGYQLPFAPESFELVSANMVVEHVAEPAQLLNELRRVLKPGGRFLFHTPNRDTWSIRIATWTPTWLKLKLIRLLENRLPDDVFPTFHRLNRRADIERFAQAAGFKVVRVDFINSSALTSALGPLAIPELLWLRRLGRPGHEKARSNIVAVLELPHQKSPTA
jgi:ubiquinone/menaquinone biosynthesis C-methylase UbiE